MALSRINEAHSDRVRRARVKFKASEIQAAGAVTSLVKTFGKIPPFAVILGTVLKRTVQMTNGAAATYALNVGDGTSSTNVLNGGDVDGGATPVATAPAGTLVNGGTFTATLTSSANLSTLTAGECEFEVRYIA